MSPRVLFEMNKVDWHAKSDSNLDGTRTPVQKGPCWNSKSPQARQALRPKPSAIWDMVNTGLFRFQHTAPYSSTFASGSNAFSGMNFRAEIWIKKWSNYDKDIIMKIIAAFLWPILDPCISPGFPRAWCLCRRLQSPHLPSQIKETTHFNTPNFFKSTLKLPKSRNSFTMDQRPNLTHLIYLMYLLKELFASK
jgi:hypothetical protein